MLLADALSRQPSRVDHKVPAEHKEKTNVDSPISIYMVQFLIEKVSEWRTATRDDDELGAFTRIIMDGWPSTRREPLSKVRPYWSYRGELAIENGLIMKGETVVIPKTLP